MLFAMVWRVQHHVELPCQVLLFRVRNPPQEVEGAEVLLLPTKGATGFQLFEVSGSEKNTIQRNHDLFGSLRQLFIGHSLQWRKNITAHAKNLNSYPYSADN